MGPQSHDHSMYRVLILGLLAGLAAASQDDKCVCNVQMSPAGRFHGVVDAAATRLLAVRVDSHEVRLSEASNQLTKLAANVKSVDGQHSGVDSNIRKLEARLTKLEGSGCDGRHFQCGGSVRRCITDLLVCDKHKDCPNGADEEPALCQTPSGTGTVWETTLHGDEGCTTRRVTKIRLVITRETVVDYFPGIVRIQASGIVTHDQDGKHVVENFNLNGVFRPAHREIEFFPPEDDLIGIRCTFDGVDNDHCEGTFTHGKGSCGHFTFTNTH